MMDNRELGKMEKAMETLNRDGAGFLVVTVGRIKGPLNAEMVRLALDLVQRRHPRLNSRIVGSLDNLHFQTGEMPLIPLRVVDKLHDEQWTDVVLEELNEKIDSSKGLLRAVLILPMNKSCVNYLILTVHHSISDGLSCLQLYSEILAYCQSFASNDPITQVISLPTLPPVEELLPESKKELRKEPLRNLPEPLGVETLGFEKCVPMELRRCGLVHRQLDAELTQQLVNICRQEKTTVQGALCAAMLFAAVRKIRTGQTNDVRVSCRSPIDLRQRLKPVISNGNMIALVSSVMSFHTLQLNTSFWELARDIKQQLHAGLEREEIFTGVLTFSQNVELLLRQPHEVLATVSVSNVGRVNIPRVYGSLELEEISFVPSIAAYGGVFYAAVTTFQGKIFLNFPFSEPAISLHTMENLINSAVSCIIDACQGYCQLKPNTHE
ncbi:phthiocerol/phthiodiolone dimycocerosyl transferase family protein [Brasilonema bromeliae]|uniref:Phthiocerol/phthiodiolone dimycocerosyl transferase n=1 Tax=Brasilonema bromeliae SPC951 TaxID=385972 RepID=A0ABX1PFR8_9CYAN|nr:alcohol acetyltransferase [Brasilonema bromeliae]NMG22441.1 alcohol acetyltransferase [Brasilonema bromeliae SPC951]